DEALDGVTVTVEQSGKTRPYRLIVVYHENIPFPLFHTAFSSVVGNEKWTQAPPPSAFSAANSPPCDETIERAIERPMPKPSCFVEKNGSKIRSGFSFGSPVPKSRTPIQTL